MAMLAGQSILLAAEPTVSDQFVGKVHAFNELVMEDHGKWLSPQSPWFSYINRQFEQGLLPAQQKQYLSLQTMGRCEALLQLEKAGFLRLHPKLAGVFSDRFVKKIFSEELVPSHSIGARRCQAIAMLNPIMETEKKLDPEFYYLSIPGTNLGNEKEGNLNPRETALWKAFSTLFDLAACFDYKPAINDIIEYEKMYLIFVNPFEQYYFYTRAKHYGINAPDVSPVVKELQRLWSPDDYPQGHPMRKIIKRYNILGKVDTLRQLLVRGDLKAARIRVFKDTYISCGKGILD